MTLHIEGHAQFHLKSRSFLKSGVVWNLWIVLIARLSGYEDNPETLDKLLEIFMK